MVTTWAKWAAATALVSTVLVSGCTANNPPSVKQQNLNGATPLRQQQTAPARRMNDNTNVHVANQAAEQIASLREVKQANVLITGHNAYVAAVLADHVQMTHAVENRIADVVRGTDPDTRNVYVSTNPDLSARFTQYTRDVQAGKPVSGFIEQFNEIVDRIFPNSR